MSNTATKKQSVRELISWVIVTPDDVPLLDTCAPTFEACILKSMHRSLDIQYAWTLLQQEGYSCKQLFIQSTIIGHEPG